MSKEIICVYQDCLLCGSRGEKLKKVIRENHIPEIRKVSFASPEGRMLCCEALFEHGIRTMPFYTDGTIFSNDVLEVVKGVEKFDKTPKKTRKNVKKPTKKSRENVKKGVENGVDS